MNDTLNLVSQAAEIEKELPSQEYALGKGLLQPFNNTNSGSRKIMHGSQEEQKLQFINPETPIIQTGYEQRFGEHSSTYKCAENDMVVIDIIPKYEGYLNSSINYVIVYIDQFTNTVGIINRVNYRYISESYGYNMALGRNEYMRGDIIPKGTPIIQPTSWDEFGNKASGVNIRTVYMAIGDTVEDPVIVSESAAKKMRSPLFDSTLLQINDNDILLNLYGDSNNYKSFPDIGEETKDGILCALRRERKEEESLYAQSRDRLSELMVTDDVYMLKGKVIDIDVHCNNIENLEDNMYTTQVKKYYNIKLEYCKRIVDCIKPLKDKGLKLTLEAEILYDDCWKTINGVKTISEKVFSNIQIRIITMTDLPLEVGDKITDRYGGKGVISAIKPDSEMPHYPVLQPNGQYILEPVEAIYNSSTVVNRENPGQTIETEAIYIGEKIMERISLLFNESYRSAGISDETDLVVTCENMIYEYYKSLSPKMAEEYKEMCNNNDIQLRAEALTSRIQDEDIYLWIPPMSSIVGIDTIRELYHKFPWIEQSDIYVTMKNSTGGTRQVKASRKMVVGKKYIYRLKQFAEEKFSAVALASTNLRAENTKSRANKLHKAAHPNTPVKWGEMEALTMQHIPFINLLIDTLMILSTSPQGRREFRQLLVGDPFVLDIKVPDNATSRQVEKVDVMLKQIGQELVFIKKRKQLSRVKKVIATRVYNKQRIIAATMVDERFRDKLKDIAKQRIDAKKKRSRAKITVAKKVDPRTADILLSFPQDVRSDILNSNEVQQNISDIVKIVDDVIKREGKPLELDEMLDHLINDEPEKRKINIATKRIARSVNPERLQQLKDEAREGYKD